MEISEGTPRPSRFDTAGADVVTLHPTAADRYRLKVEQVQTALKAGDAAGFEAIALVRELIRHVRVIPTAGGAPVGLEIAGDLAALLNLNEPGPDGMVSVVAGAGFGRSPTGETGMASVVAGIGFFASHYWGQSIVRLPFLPPVVWTRRRACAQA